MLFFPTWTKFVCQEPVNGVFFWKEARPFSQDEIYFSRISFFKQAYQKNYCSSLKTRYLIGKNVSFWVSSWEFLSFTQESIFVFKLIVLHIRLTLLVRKNHIPKYSCWWSLCAPLRSEYNLIRKLCIRFPKTTHRSNNPIVRKSIGHNCFQSIPYYICIHRNPHKFHFQNSLIHRNKSEQYCS